MFTSANSTREKALLAAAAADRAMKRSVCCKSQYKFTCFSCGEMIQRGDKITVVNGGEGMTLRFRGSDCRNGLAAGETCFFQPSSGSKRWVHIGCNPCEWYGFLGVPEDEGFTPQLVGVWTDWGAKIESEFAEDYALTGRWDMEEFLERNGYPQEKYMSDRIKHAVTRFQALWRGYLYKKAYPIALQQTREERALARARAIALYQEMQRDAPDIGDHVEILFNVKEPSESVYSGEVIEVQYRGCEDIKIKVKYHYDGEVRKYTGKKFKLLKKECEEHKRKLGIEAKLTGRLNTARIGLMNAVTSQTRPSNQDWRYHYPDGNPVE